MKRTLASVALALVTSTLVVIGGAASSGAFPASAPLDAGQFHTCAVTATGDARCWGSNGSGQAPAQVTGPFTAIATGASHTCALTPDGDARCWGFNVNGQAPAHVTGPFTAIAAGDFHTCALTQSGDVRCWGYSVLGQAPAQVTGPFAAITAGAYHTCAITTGGDARCWGANFNQQAPAQVTGPFNAISAGAFHTCAITGSGSARCWGYNSLGQAPVQVTGPFTTVAGGTSHTCALTPDGNARCWGFNGYRQAPPGSVVGPFTALAAGEYHTCALTANAELRCWGSNDNAQAPALQSGPFGVTPDATPTVTSVTGPTAPIDLSSVASIAAAFTPGDGDHTCSVDWGDGSSSAAAVGSDSCSGTHAFGGAGMYTVTVTLTDADGDAASGTLQHIVVYDPEGGFITGGGSMDSPAGAYVADPRATGTTTFTISAKYHNGGTAPTGNSHFRMKTADMEFRSTSYAWLVTSDATAYYEGSGTMDGVGDYSFRVTVGNDGGSKRQNSTLRLKIWDAASGIVVYDNQPGAVDDAPATCPIRGGAIVIHPA